VVECIIRQKIPADQEKVVMRRSIVVFLIATLFSTPAWSGGFVGLGLGAGDLDINNVSVAPDFELTSVSDSATSFNVTAGYEFENGFHVVGSYEEIESIEFLGLGESVELEGLKLGAGFSRPISKRFRAGGTVGLASWDLEARESILFNPGPEATGGVDDSGFYLDLGIEWVINDTFRLPLTFNYNDFDFGDATMWRIGVVVHFQ